MPREDERGQWPYRNRRDPTAVPSWNPAWARVAEVVGSGGMHNLGIPHYSQDDLWEAVANEYNARLNARTVETQRLTGLAAEYGQLPLGDPTIKSPISLEALKRLAPGIDPALIEEVWNRGVRAYVGPQMRNEQGDVTSAAYFDPPPARLPFDMTGGEIVLGGLGSWNMPSNARGETEHELRHAIQYGMPWMINNDLSSNDPRELAQDIKYAVNDWWGPWRGAAIRDDVREALGLPPVRWEDDPQEIFAESPGGPDWDLGGYRDPETYARIHNPNIQSYRGQRADIERWNRQAGIAPYYLVDAVRRATAASPVQEWRERRDRRREMTTMPDPYGTYEDGSPVSPVFDAVQKQKMSEKLYRRPKIETEIIPLYRQSGGSNGR